MYMHIYVIDIYKCCNIILLGVRQEMKFPLSHANLGSTLPTRHPKLNFVKFVKCLYRKFFSNAFQYLFS